MTDAIGFEDMPGNGPERDPMFNRREGEWGGLARLLDGLPWWALVALAAVTFLFLHELAAADGGAAHDTAATGPTTSQIILIILAGAGQYLFPVLLLAEAGGVAAASRLARAWRRMEMSVDAPEERGDNGEPREPVQGIWSLALLTRLAADRFAALAMAYYRERGMRCDLLPSGTDGAIVLRLYQEGLDKPPVLVKFRAKGAAWVGAKQIAVLRDVMDREAIGKGLFMTPGAFSKDAKEAALANGVTLIDGRLFLMMIGRLMPPARERLLTLAMQAD